MTFNRKQTLVTGGCGFIGSHLVDELLRQGARVRVLDNLATGYEDNLSHCATQIDWVNGDIRDPKTCAAACEGVDFVFHQAALGSVPRSLEEPGLSFSVNVQGTIEVLNAAREAGVSRVVYASSSSVYGDTAVLPKVEGEEADVLSPYALTKQTDESIAALFYRCYQQEIVGLRYFNVYGPRQSPEGPYAAVVPRFFQAILSQQQPTIYGDGEQSRDFTAVADAVAANLKAALAPKSACGRAFNVAGGKAVTVNQIASIIAQVLESDIKPIHLEPRQGDVRHSLADLTACAKHLGFQPSVSLDAGLALCREYYQELFSRPVSSPS